MLACRCVRETPFLGDRDLPVSLAEAALGVLDAPGDFRHLGEDASSHVDEHYRLGPCLDRMVALYEEVVGAYRGAGR